MPGGGGGGAAGELLGEHPRHVGGGDGESGETERERSHDRQKKLLRRRAERLCCVNWPVRADVPSTFLAHSGVNSDLANNSHEVPPDYRENPTAETLVLQNRAA